MFKYTKNSVKNQQIKELFEDYVSADVLNAFWDRKQHMVELSHERNFDERNNPTNECLIPMNKELLEFSKKEIQSHLNKKLIRSSKSSWSCVTFMFIIKLKTNMVLLDCVINCKLLNKILLSIRYRISNKKRFLERLYDAKYFQI